MGRNVTPVLESGSLLPKREREEGDPLHNQREEGGRERKNNENINTPRQKFLTTTCVVCGRSSSSSIDGLLFPTGTTLFYFFPDSRGGSHPSPF